MEIRLALTTSVCKWKNPVGRHGTSGRRDALHARRTRTDEKEDDGRISRDRQHASSRLDSPIVERRLVAVPAGSRTICIAEYEAPVLFLPDVYESRCDSIPVTFGMIPDSKPRYFTTQTRRGEASGLGGIRTLVSPPCVVAVPEEVFLHWPSPSPSSSTSSSSSSPSAGPMAATTTSATPLHAWRRG
ncbi:hypothetical protein ALC53_11070 [Atta colombica]|uniref:Uncharacterized protein n=1 Tax=Atta colombica TaxID=520822 RepID=A0A195B2A5_9HYME|nr:hypothetical protein ALC53_11070 [Atta colombica]